MRHNSQLSVEEIKQTEALHKVIVDEILVAGGTLAFDRFMELALYRPELGYYMSGTEQFGVEGDFVTAPGLTPFFGRCVAVQLADLLTDRPDMRVLEYGAGNGQLAVAVLAELERLGCLPAGYDIVERSALLRGRQRQLLEAQLPHLLERVHWLEGSPSGFCGIIIANELLDALPVQRLIKSPTGFDQVVVKQDGDALVLTAQPLSDPRVNKRLGHLGLAEGYLTEINFAAETWVESLANVLDEGLVLLVDYGYCRDEYYHPQRNQGTFLCYFRHTAADDPVRFPGLQDMTAHIDFTAMAEAASRGGLQVSGFTTQANFLISCGILDQLADRADDDNYIETLAPVKQLLLPGGMGEVFKVLALTRGYAQPLRGMAARDIRHTL
ncbi:MAG: class I SAM-dependent methyltransferase [Gammaproteobacteria bacterium]|nr:MAG: class I SAM-dependent methyltransferase [Gammaproteobacteria bacterium]